ncbi:MAG TPA: choice-of-anchor R domain-containing protein [Gaiellaceae bacterium]|nr:choice-of-anchor R domain-containing protein [Gaiellaceae bacterium]
MVMRVLLRRSSCGSGGARRTGFRLPGLALVLALTMVGGMLAVVPSASAGVLDQTQPGISNVQGLVSDTSNWAQTFTNGVSGGLDQIDIAVVRQGAGTASLRVEIRSLSGGVPSSLALANETLPAASVPAGVVPTGFLSVPLTPPAPVTAGTQYAIVVSSSSCGFVNCYAWGFGPAGDPYPAGLGLHSGNGGVTWAPVNAFGSTDFAFKTYVIAPPTSKQQCKKGRWRRFANPSFKNQGQCVAYANHHDGKGKDDQNSSSGKNKGHGKKK